MYQDLHLPVDDVNTVVHRDRLAMLLCLGYESAAAVHSTSARLTETDRCSHAPVSATSLASSDTGVKQVLQSKAGGAFRTTPRYNMNQLTRLNFTAADPVQAQLLVASNSVASSYDIIAIQPKTERVLQQACNSLDVDIISLELSQRLPFKLRLQTVAAALARGLYFEICYSSALRDPVARRHLFSNAQALVRATRGQSILLSSGARNAFELRAPPGRDQPRHSVRTDTDPSQGAALSTAPAAIVAHAAARKLTGGALSITQIPAAAVAAAAQAGGSKGTTASGSSGQAPNSHHKTPPASSGNPPSCQQPAAAGALAAAQSTTGTADPPPVQATERL
ncbi:MAG: hypothetical protein WDW36_001018 [Sanguina aurantia]